MKVTIKVPSSIIKICNECGFNENQTKEIVTHFIEEVLMNNDYGKLHDEFDIWLNSEEFEELLFIK